MIQIQPELTAASLLPALRNLWSLAGEKILAIERSAQQIGGTPVFTVRGKYVAQGWTEWTQGFQFGAPLLLFDATDDATFLQIGREHTLHQMAPHVTHFGVHDHGFNQVSTYGNLWRLIGEHRIESEPHEQQLYELALKASGAVQAARWTPTDDGEGFIYSFNGPHSLFADTIRSLRALALAWRLGHVLWMENDRQVSLLERLVQHAQTTARYNVYYGEGRDTYDLWGRVAHESLFNTNDGRYRCPSTQQGYSPFTTWTRGLAWIMLGYPEQLQFLETVSEVDLQPLGGRAPIQSMLLRARVPHVTSTWSKHRPVAFPTGIPGPPACRSWVTISIDPLTRRTITNRSIAPPLRSRPKAYCDWGPFCDSAATNPPAAVIGKRDSPCCRPSCRLLT